MTPKKKDKNPLRAFVDSRLPRIQAEAVQVFKGLLSKGHRQRQEIEALIGKLNTRGARALEPRAAKRVGNRASQAALELQRRLVEVQARVLEVVGVASASQVKAISRELVRLRSKLDAVVGEKRRTPRLTSGKSA